MHFSLSCLTSAPDLWARIGDIEARGETFRVKERYKQTEWLQVKDAAASMDPWLQAPDLQENLGHMALAEGRMEDALQVGCR